MKLINEVFGKVRKARQETIAFDNVLDEELLDALGWSEKKASNRKSFLSRKYLNGKEIKALEDYITKKFGELGIKMVTKDKFLKVKEKRAAFNAVTKELIFRKKFTFYEAFHELKHAEEFKLLGEVEYLKGASGSPSDRLIRTYKREKYVFDRIMEKGHLFNDSELQNAQWVLQREIIKLERAGIDYRKL